jgi:hypothetical protein
MARILLMPRRFNHQWMTTMTMMMMTTTTTTTKTSDQHDRELPEHQARQSQSNRAGGRRSQKEV